MSQSRKAQPRSLDQMLSTWEIPSHPDFGMTTEQYEATNIVDDKGNDWKSTVVIDGVETPDNLARRTECLKVALVGLFDVLSGLTHGMPNPWKAFSTDYFPYAPDLYDLVKSELAVLGYDDEQLLLETGTINQY
jgi:hypothetical protein